ncbi:Pde12 [Symbiodinium natans]|uniref:Pde12 protein n=1 Tax=Symbiodinium natans TaxID=878477 RepID=A0A812MN16_9DINO|nr:Pde12 [Symbiodinium natans]
MESKAAVKRAALERLKDHAASKGGKCISEAYTNCMTKVQWECNLGHTWQATPHSVLNGRRWCPQCAINKGRLSLDQLQAHARKRGGRCLSDEYRNNRTKVRWQCKLGHTWEAVGYSVLNKGTWCPECARTTRSRSNRTLRDLQEHAAARGGKCLATEYVSLRAKVRWRCEKGHTWSATSQSVLNQKTWCPACAKRAPLGLERLRSHAARLGGHCLAEDYKNSYSKVRWKCSYGHVWRAKPRDVFHKGSWCPECQKIGLARLQAHATSLGGRCLCKKYSNRKAKVLWECQLGHRWKASAKHILHQKTWCPQCAVSVWKTEAEIRSILEAIFAPSMFESSYPKFLEGLQLDGYCSELSLAFEYQGEQHYDPDNYFHFGNPSSFDSQLERDDRKRQLCDEAGVRLVLVPCFANDKRLFVLTALLQWFSISDITAPMLSQASRMEIQLQLPAPLHGEIQMLRQRDEEVRLQLEKLLQKVGPKLKKANGSSEAAGALVDEAEAELSGDTPACDAWPRARHLRLETPSGRLEIPIYCDPPLVIKCRMTTDCPMEGVPLLAEAELSGCDVSSCSWTWQRRAAGAEKSEPWRDVGRGLRYRPASADVGYFLRVQCHPPRPGKAVPSQTSKQPVTAPPADSFRWACLAEPCAKPRLRVLTYNILADSCATRKTARLTTFSYCDPAILLAGPRRQRVLRDLLQINADLMGLQEVDIGQRLALEPPLQDCGWDAAFAGRPNCATALLWRRERFEVEEPPKEWPLSGAVERLPGLNEEEAAAIRAHPATAAVLAQVQNAAQSVLLRDLQTGRRLLVANTHLYFHANANHIRLLQLYMLLRVLAKEAARIAHSAPVAVLLFGDLNARKGAFGPSDRGCCPQAAYRLIRDGEIRREDPDWRFSLWQPQPEGNEAGQSAAPPHKAEGGRCICCQDFGVFPGLGTCPLCDGEGFGGEPLLSLDLRRPLDLEDANEHLQVTNFTRDFQECLDYILIDRRHLRVARSFPAPPLEALRRHTALPSPEFPSDHIPVFTEIEFHA